MRIYKKIIMSLSFIALATASAMGAELAGCMVYNGKALMPDPKCACVAKKACASFRKTEYNQAFFSAKDSNGRGVFSEKIKGLYKESYELYNKVIEMKSNGLGHSEEIKNFYSRLNYVNGEIRKELIKTQPKFMAEKKLEYESAMKERKVEKDKINKRLKQFNSGTVGKLPEAPKSEQDVIKKVEKKVEVKNTVTENPNVDLAKTKESEEQLSDKRYMLDNVKKEKYIINETDTLFDIISKTYKKRAYKELLEP